MTTVNSLKRARYRAVAQMLEVARLNSDWDRPGSSEPVPAAWLEMWPSRRAEYLSATRLMAPKLLSRLITEFPAAGEVWDSDIWMCLQENADPFFLERRLRSRLSPERRAMPLGDVLEELSTNPMEHEEFALPLVVTYVCAVRLANEFRFLENKRDKCGVLAMRLARALHMISVDERLAPLAKEVWVYSGHTISQGLRTDGSRICLSEMAFDLAQDYIRRVEAGITMLMLPRKPPRRLPVNALQAVVKDVLFELTEPSCTRAYRAATAMLSLGRHDGQVKQRRLDPDALVLRETD